MVKVKIFGAGSIGNHLANACRTKGWDVTICDVDAKALERTKNEIYPQRYGTWDPAIKVATVADAPKGGYDVIIIGTPPHTHIDIALKAIEEEKPKVIIIEKPLCTPSLTNAQELYDLGKKTGTVLLVGYNHTVCKNTIEADRLLSEGVIGTPLTMNASFQEYWGGIFKAHPWLKGPEDTYLGFSHKGGGASGEHSHAVNIWQHFAHHMQWGRITEVTAVMDIVKNEKVDYDRIVYFNVKTEKGFHGMIIQDVVTEPPLKYVRIQGDKGYIDWRVNYDSGIDAVQYQKQGSDVEVIKIPKKRPDDFKGEIENIDLILHGKLKPEECPLYIERGLQTMMVVAAAHRSVQEKRTMKIDYTKGFTQDAITLP